VAEAAIPRRLFVAILDRIQRLLPVLGVAPSSSPDKPLRTAPVAMAQRKPCGRLIAGCVMWEAAIMTIVPLRWPKRTPCAAPKKRGRKAILAHMGGLVSALRAGTTSRPWQLQQGGALVR